MSNSYHPLQPFNIPGLSPQYLPNGTPVCHPQPSYYHPPSAINPISFTRSIPGLGAEYPGSGSFQAHIPGAIYIPSFNFF